MRDLLKLFYIQMITAVMLLIPQMTWASETETHVWIPPLESVLPFVILLLCIAFLPLIKWTHHWWEKNSNRALVSAILGVPVAFYVFSHDPHRITHTLVEYLQFISYVGCLFIVASGIFVTGNLLATPKVNTLFLIAGYCLASIIGTTGAAMVLIYPLIRTNIERKHKIHTAVFFIFLVCNIGGLLTPIGDPPLFLGYLRGIDFFWFMQKLWWLWVLVGAVLIGVYYILDCYHYKREDISDKLDDAIDYEPVGLHGKPNILFLMAIVCSVAFAVPSPYREGIMWLMVLCSLTYSKKSEEGRQARKNNHFSFSPIIEVTIIFAGIFATMMPALALLANRGSELGIVSPVQYYWYTGLFSSWLDNAPTFLCFLELNMSTQGTQQAADLMTMSPRTLAGISLGAVFFGAMTYIGNAPNFMVRSIAEHQKVRMPSFLGYLFWSIPILLPVFFIVSLLIQFI